MKRQFIVLFIATTLLFFFNACKTENEPSNEMQPAYLPMSIGNYWIYQHFIVDSLGNEHPLNSFDSVVIIKDTLINNKLFYEFGGKQNTAFFHQFLRDSAGYLVNNSGEKIFSSHNFNDILSERTDSIPINRINYQIYKLKTKMESTPVQKSTTLGVFNTLNASGMLTAYYYDNSANLTDSINTFQNTYYAQNVGIVIQTYHYYFDMKLNKRKGEKRLIRYKLQDN